MHAALRQAEHELTQYRRVWRSSVFTSTLTPLLFLAAMGLGLGQAIDGNGGSGAAALGGVRYLSFLAPGLLAAMAMQLAAGESLWPVQGGFSWHRFFHASAATPLRPFDIFLGWIIWVTARLVISAVLFVAVAASFGVVASPLGVLAVPAAALTGLAFAAPITAFTATQVRETSFPLIMRFGVMPLFLFSGAFFPVSQLPTGLQLLARLTPLWHGVDLCRSLMLGTVDIGSALVHLAVLAAFAGAGMAWGASTFTRRLSP
ncbi:MAG: Efflux ABC transporter, permease protein [uncultured Acidimicrobiales bacterium]|uniref:Transport permease protein n=1 Tax=uncultured Acidimicrobiales bacterium TaxID=310071 RepID=A0A6J4IWN8_9ACTN|nr:MAG: Efflux ABC transporter, permease protein [uncultured Acidimicrobiales bacterium]